MLGFELDFWDYATFATAALAGVAVMLTYTEDLWCCDAAFPEGDHDLTFYEDTEMAKIRPTVGTDGIALPTLPPERDARVWARLEASANTTSTPRAGLALCRSTSAWAQRAQTICLLGA